jgi:hypothetical protein
MGTISAQSTRFEKTNGAETDTYPEVIAWYKNMDKLSPLVHMKEMGETDAGYPLHLVTVSADGSGDPKQWHKEKKVVLLINNGIHPGEPDGIDATMLLLRDITDKKVVLPANVALAIIPVYNIGGALNRNAHTRVNQDGPKEYGFRGNSQNLDLNRDFTKNDSKEARSFAQIFHYLDPDIFIDNHVSDGADYQHTMTLITTQYDKLGPSLGTYLKNILEPVIYSGMAEKGWEMIPYMDFESLDIDKGAIMFNESPRYSTGYAALFNTMGFMPETHMLKPYKERVRSTYDLMITFIEEAARHADGIISERAKAKQLTASQTLFPLSWKSDSAKSTAITFKGYEQKFSTSQATGLQKMAYDRNKPFTAKMKFFNTYLPKDIIQKPKAYIIPQGWYEVITRLKVNGVKTEQMKADTVLDVTRYRIESYKSLATAYEKHHKNYAIKTTSHREQVHFLKGDHIVYLNQPSNRYIIEMLEPTGDDGFFSWNFFDGILQQKEGYSDYRWEDLAAEVLQNDPELKNKVEAKKAEDPKFAASATAILDFIYKNSKYYEKAHMNYPVYRLEN